SAAKSTMTRCKGREQPEGLTFALRRNGRTRSFLNRYCGSWTSISPNFVCQRTFFHLGDASEVADEFPSPSPPPASPPSPAALRVPNAASPRPTALPQRPPPSNRRQGYRRDTVSNVRMAAQKGKQRFIAQIRARHQLRPPKSPPTKLTPHRVESHPFRLADEIHYIQRRATARDRCVVAADQLVLFSTETGDAWLLDPSDHLAARLASDGDPESIAFDETDTSFQFAWPGNYRLDGPAFGYTDRQSRRVSTIIGYSTQLLANAERR